MIVDTKYYFVPTDLVQTNRLRYFHSSFAVKREIVSEVMHAIKKRGGRFLRVKDNVWSIVPDETSRLKIAHAIQYHIRTELAQSKDASSAKADDDMDPELSQESNLSDHDRIVRAIQKHINKLQNRPLSNELPRLYDRSESQGGSIQTKMPKADALKSREGQSTRAISPIAQKELISPSSFKSEHVQNKSKACHLPTHKNNAPHMRINPFCHVDAGILQQQMPGFKTGTEVPVQKNFQRSLNLVRHVDPWVNNTSVLPILPGMDDFRPNHFSFVPDSHYIRPSLKRQDNSNCIRTETLAKSKTLESCHRNCIDDSHDYSKPLVGNADARVNDRMSFFYRASTHPDESTFPFDCHGSTFVPIEDDIESLTIGPSGEDALPHQ
jgi:hypothetical protein